MDYQGNSNKDKLEKAKPQKKVGRVVKGEVLVQKKSVGRKFKDLFIMADFKSVATYVVSDVMLPAARNMILDASFKGIERLLYGDAAVRRRQFGNGPRVTYNNPVQRPYRDVTSRMAPPGASGGVVTGRSRSAREEFIISSREDAEQVLERMNDIIDQYEVVSIADFNDLVGFPTSAVDNKWGWTFLGDVQVRQIREGYLIDLPPAEPIN